VTIYFKFRQHVLADVFPEILPFEKFGFASKVRRLFFVQMPFYVTIYHFHWKNKEKGG
jgi:hypothetical protein